MGEQSRQSLGFLAAVVILAGACAPIPKVGVPDTAELAAVARGEKAIVLLKHSVIRDNEPFTIAGPMFSYGNIDAGASVSDTTLRAASDAALQEGWLYTVLSPGNYYFLAYPPGMQQNPPAVTYHVDSGRYGRLANRSLKLRKQGFWFPSMQRFMVSGPRPDDFDAIPGFLLQVPEGGKVFYVGSLRIACGTIPGLFGRLTDACAAFEVTDDTGRAREFSMSAFGANIPFATRIVTRYGDRAPTLAHAALRSLNVEIHVGALGRGGLTGASPGPTFFIHGGGGSVASARAFGVFNILALLAQGAQTASEEADARVRAKKWAPCFKRLEEQADTETLNAALKRALAEEFQKVEIRAMRSAAKGADPTPEARIKITWQGSGLRECVEKGTFCVEIAVRARLEEKAKDVSRYDTTLVYSNDYRSDPIKTSYRLYQVAVPQRSTCRKIEAYCEANGVAVMQQEIETGIRHIATRIAADLTRAQ